MSESNITKKIVWQDYWWIPGENINEVPGTLSYSLDETPTLEISEIEQDLSKLFDKGIRQYKLVHGVDYSGKKLTLYDVFITNRKSGFSGISITRFAVNRIYVGVHFDNERDILFDRMDFSISNLWEWAQLTGINREVVFDADGKPDRFKLEYKAPVPIEADIGNGKVIKIKSSSSFSLNHSDEVNISEKTVLEIKSTSLRTFEDFMDDAFIFSSFISIGLSTPTYIYRIRAYSVDPLILYY